MPIFQIPGGEIDLPRNLALLDTNVLAAFANADDSLHDQAKLFIENENDFSLIVVPPVIVETCGLLSKRTMHTRLIDLLRWLWTPGNVVFLPSHHFPNLSTALAAHTSWMSKFNIDYVDSYLVETAHKITHACDLRPSAPIVTFDTQDFWRCSSKGQSFSLYDMKDLDLIPM
jgi:predicted nucleic acid-binding protein